MRNNADTQLSTQSSGKIGVSAMLLIVAVMIVGAFGACSKSESSTGTAGNGSGTTIVTKTVTKTTAREATGTVTSSTAKTETYITASSVAAATGNSDVSGADDTQGNQPGQEDPADKGDTGKWAQDINVTMNNDIVDQNIDLKGRTLIIGSWSTSSGLPVDAEGQTPQMIIWARRIKAAQEKYNFKAEFYIETGNSSTRYQENLITRTMAGIKLADIFRTATSYQFPLFVKNNIMVPLDEYIDYEAPMVKVNQYMYNGSYWMGRHYGISEWFGVASGSQIIL